VTGIFKSFSSEQRQTLFWVFAVLGVYWLSLIHQLGAQWSIYEQYNYGWAVPFLCLFLLWQRILKSEIRGQASESSKLHSHLPTSVGYLLVALCALLYAPTRFFHEANPIWRLTSLLWALEVIGITLVILYFVFQTSHSALRISHFIFPVCFFLVAVPWPSVIETFLVQTFTHLNVSATVEVLGWFGIPALQHANVIEVATGSVGVDEACSGIRSFQATLMIALFFGEFYRLNWLRRVACVLAGFALSFLFNLARTTLLTWVAAKKGVPAVAGWHDPAGVTILVLCFFTLWLVAVWMGGKQKQKAETLKGVNRSQGAEGGSPTTDHRPLTTAPSTLNPQLSTIRHLAIALLIWFLVVEAGTELWFRSHERIVSGRADWLVNGEAPGSGLMKEQVPAGIRTQFNYDDGFQAAGKDDAGNFWQLYYFRWFPSHSLKNRVAVQLAKTHGPEMCLPAIGMTLKSDLGIITVPVGNRTFAFHEFVFLANEQPLHVFHAIYEDQTGSTVLANRRENTADRLAAALAGSRNDGQSFLEVAVAGPETPEDARTTLQTELQKIIVAQP
jgi:exosortase